MKHSNGRLLRWVAALAALSGCAQMGAPPGGPADETAPTVLATVPAADSTGLRAPFAIRIAFSEKMDKRSVERGLRLFPRPGRIRTEWEENTLVVESERTSGDSLADIGTITVTVSGRAEDRHGLSMETPHAFSFTSHASLPPGSASGTIEGLSKKADAPPPIVRALRPARPDTLLPELLLEGEASAKGAFLLRPLPAGEDGKIILLAFQDENENDAPDWEEELYGYSDTLLLTFEDPSADSVSIRLVTADSPGSVAGRVIPPGAADSLVVAFLPEGDTTRSEAFVEPDSTGAYSVTELPPGKWRVLLIRGSLERLSLEGVGDATAVLVERSLPIAPGERRTGFDLPERPPEPQVMP
ncbi:MAG: hypothetical protein EHM19_07385 [Candidatus Latescibacterota bacterium]|nr:MAG: hypothetical protein EHM19_07385 [Candidatus Latescibacterota bacterium]